MNIEKEQEEVIVNFGAFEYSVQKMASILDVDTSIIQEELLNHSSRFAQLVQKGRDMSDYAIDLKLFEMAKAGDLKALDKLDYRKRVRNSI